MRVGLVIYGTLDPVSGGYLYDRKLVEHLEGRGDDVIVFQQPKRSYPLRPVENANISFWRRLASADLDVLLQDELNHGSLAFGNYWLRHRIDAPIVAIVHHLRAQERPFGLPAVGSRFLEWLYLRATDARIYNSPATKQSVEALAGARPHVVARPSGCRFGAAASAEEIYRRATSEGPLRLLFVGNLIPRKRPDLLIEGLSRVEATPWRLDLVGNLSADPSYVAALRERVRRLDDPSRVTLHGRVPDEELKRRLTASHVLAVPSVHEGYGIVYVEAMGRGLPVLAGRSGGVRDVVRHGETGRFVDTADDVARAVEAWSENREHLAKLGEAAAAHYRSTPTWTETCRRMASFLDRIVNDTAHSPSPVS
jgi:glycosyltransferase involved in cell wall biosynthesis